MYHFKNIGGKNSMKNLRTKRRNLYKKIGKEVLYVRPREKIARA